MTTTYCLGLYIDESAVEVLIKNCPEIIIIFDFYIALFSGLHTTHCTSDEWPCAVDGTLTPTAN